MYDAQLPRIFAVLVRAVVASPLPEVGWYSAAEAAVTALYALHPSPEHLSAAMLRHLALAAFSPADLASGAGQEQQEGEAMDAEGPAAAPDGGEAEEDSEEGAGQQGAPPALHSVSSLSRFFFALGHVALQHLVRLVGLAR